MANEFKRKISILIVDDDQHDELLIREAFADAAIEGDILFLNSGEELLHYLQRKHSYEFLKGAPLPGLILLDLNMPKKNGREVLREIKSHPQFKSLPVIVFTTSKSQKDVDEIYELGANTFISKPNSYEGFIEVFQILGKYWLGISKLPNPNFSNSDFGSVRDREKESGAFSKL